jgi:hypothetical protein
MMEEGKAFADQIEDTAIKIKLLLGGKKQRIRYRKGPD